VTAAAAARRAFWEEEGRRTAGSLDGVAAAVVLGANLEAAALVARGIARAVATRRHVALGDLAGDLAPLYELAGGEDAPGLTDCFREGLPLNDVARPAPGSDSLFVLPSGAPPVAVPEIFSHERWPRLVAGFAQAGALLLLVAPVDAPGLAALVAVTSGVIMVDTPPGSVKRFPVLATIDAPEPPRASTSSRSTRMAWWVAAALVAVTAGAGVWRTFGGSLTSHRTDAGIAPAVAATPPTSAPVPARTADTLHLSDPVAPADSAAIASFAVEVVAASTLAGANSFLADNRETTSLRGATVSPVTAGGGSTLWYKVIVGACPDRACADALLDALRRERLAGDAEGRVVRLPYAVLLEANVDRSRLVQVVQSWSGRGVTPYALVQTDGSVRVFAGAFETPAQAAPLAVALRAARVAPAVAFRTGRMF
jgi:hypothetical protein